MTEQKYLPLEACGWYVRTQRTPDGDGGFMVADCSSSPNGAKYAALFAAAPQMFEALQLLAKVPFDEPLTSGVRAVIDVALALAGQETM